MRRVLWVTWATPLCRRSHVSMVEAAHVGDLDDLAQFRLLDTPRLRGIASTHADYDDIDAGEV